MDSARPPPPRSGSGRWVPARRSSTATRPPPLQTSRLGESRIPVARQTPVDPPRTPRPVRREPEIVLEQGGQASQPRTPRREYETRAPRSPEEKRHSKRVSPDSTKRESAYRKKNGQYTPPSNETKSSQHRRTISSNTAQVFGRSFGGNTPPRSPRESPPRDDNQPEGDPEVTRFDYRAQRRAENVRSWGSEGSAVSASEVADLKQKLVALETENKRLRASSVRSNETTPTIETRLSEVEEQLRDLNIRKKTQQNVDEAKKYIGEVRTPTTPRVERYHNGDREELYERQPNRRSGEGPSARVPTRRSDERTSNPSTRNSVIIDEPQEDIQRETSEERRRRKKQGKKKEVRYRQ